MADEIEAIKQKKENLKQYQEKYGPLPGYEEVPEKKPPAPKTQYDRMNKELKEKNIQSSQKPKTFEELMRESDRLGLESKPSPKRSTKRASGR